MIDCLHINSELRTVFDFIMQRSIGEAVVVKSLVSGQISYI